MGLCDKKNKNKKINNDQPFTRFQFITLCLNIAFLNNCAEFQ